MKLSLNGLWRLDFISPEGIKQTVSATVPGDFIRDLENAEIERDIFFADNVLQLQKYENTHMYYFCTFIWNNSPARLVFEGLDTYADIYLNGILVGSSENMFIQHAFSCTPREGENTLSVHIKPAVAEAEKTPLPAFAQAQTFNYESLRARKAAHMYGWDIAPRIVSGGIWRDVYIETVPEYEIKQPFFFTESINGDNARCAFFCELSMTEGTVCHSLYASNGAEEKLILQLNGKCGDSEFYSESRVYSSAVNLRFEVNKPKLWYPKNYGEPDVYDFYVKLLQGDKILASASFKSGIRVIELVRTETTDSSGNGEFLFKVNGKRVFVLGTNHVPADALHSRDKERLPEIMSLMDDIGINMIRIWGGGVYENDYFYNYCDTHGIMVWQDFMMACGIYPNDSLMKESINIETEVVVKRLRNHPCIILWAGDNECDCACLWGAVKRDPNKNILTRTVIPDVLREHDLSRPYIPSSPYIGQEAYKTGAPTSEDHLWGPRDWFKGNFYGTTVCHFASETGYHGCPSPASLKKMIRPEQLWNWRTDGADYPKPDWRAHAPAMRSDEHAPYSDRINLMARQVKTLFGSEPDSLEDFALASQISQAEAMKYFIERFRITKWRRTGIIWWNMIDCWPQVSDAITDYFYVKKLAYSYIKRSQNPICLMFSEPSDGYISLYAVNDSRVNTEVCYSVRDIIRGETLIEGETTAVSDENREVCRLTASDNVRYLAVEYKYNNEKHINHHVENMPGMSFNEYKRFMKIIGFDLDLQGF